MSDIGASSPCRWQLAQFLKKMGATSLLKVMVVGPLASPALVDGTAMKQSTNKKVRRAEVARVFFIA